VVYVNAGTQLARIESLQGILSPALVGSFVLLGVFPLIARHIVDAVNRRKVYARWKAARPRRFDRNLIVIGAGAAGLVTSYIAAAVKAKVTLVEAHRMGGDCLNFGCVPSKALIRSATLAHQMRHAGEYGLAPHDAPVDFGAVMERIERVIAAIEPHDSVARYTALGVDVVAGHARLVSPWAVEITRSDGTLQTLSARSIVLATGARPVVPPLPGLADVGALTSDTLWGLRTLPRRLVVLGGGPIGCELAQAFALLGSQVTQVEVLPRLLSREDADVSDFARKALERDGVEVLSGHQALRCGRDEGGTKFIVVEAAGSERRIEFDELICAVGRVARLEGYGLEELGIPVTKGRTVEVNEFLETAYPNILACGDVAGPFQFTHTAAHMAWYASVNALFGRSRKFKVDYSVIPWATFTEPEVARVGLNESEAKEKGIAHQVVTYGIDDLDRAIADGEAHGFVKVIVKPGTDRILGATIVGEHAGDLIAEFVAAMRHGIGLNKVLGTIHIYPTMAEASKYAAGVWKRSTVTRGQMDFLAAFHDWTRGAGGLGRVLGRVRSLLSDKRPYHGRSGE
jgi:pyruvate/2-oxoglutarate dehydrogenase complex dihydrolipoamide dehydrogenase (E3) component